jgi:hypothetical protein
MQADCPAQAGLFLCERVVWCVVLKHKKTPLTPRGAPTFFALIQKNEHCPNDRQI